MDNCFCLICHKPVEPGLVACGIEHLQRLKKNNTKGTVTLKAKGRATKVKKLLKKRLTHMATLCYYVL